MGSLSDTLKRRRRDLGLTLAQIADQMGVTEATVQRWESGNIKSLRHGKIAKLAEVLHVSPAEIMGWDDEGKIEKPASISADGWEAEAIQLLRSLSEDELARELAYLRQRAGDSDK